METDCPVCGGLMTRKVGPWGAFLACENSHCRGTRRLPANHTTDAERLIALKQFVRYVAEQHTPRMRYQPATAEMLSGFAASVLATL